MHEPEGRVARFEHHDRRNDLAAVLEQLLPDAGRRAQLAFEFAAVSLFWGFIVYLAVVVMH